MIESIEIVIVDIIRSVHCAASEDGEKVYNAIHSAFQVGKNVRLSFRGVEDLTSAFLNAAIGQLYGVYSEEAIKTKLSVSDAAQDDLVILKRVVERAKGFFKDSKSYKTATDKALGGGSES